MSNPVGYRVTDQQYSPSEPVTTEAMLNTLGQQGDALSIAYVDPQRDKTRWVFTTSANPVPYKVVDQPWSPTEPAVTESMLNGLGQAGWQLSTAYMDPHRERTRWIFSQPQPSAGGGIPEAPTDGSLYGRQSAAWAPIAATPLASDVLPQMNGTAAAGSGVVWSRSDHVHPSDTTRVAKAGDTMTGTLTVNGATTLSSTLNVTGSVTLSSFLIINSTNPSYYLNAAAAGQSRFVQGLTNGSTRWSLVLGDSTGEGGSNAGSNFAILRYSDTNVQLGGAPLAINRASGAVSIQGSNTSDTAVAGFVGEIIAAPIVTNQAMSTGITMNVGSVSLTAGDWDVDGYVQFVPSAAPTALSCGINATSATMPAGNTQYSTQQLALAFTSAATQVLNTGRTRISLAITTSIYLVAQGTFASGTLNAQGYISARRRR